jgi:hypothetical protein
VRVTVTQEWFTCLSAELREAAHSLADNGVQEACFSPPAALQVIAEMRQGDLPCLGGDEWICNDGKYRPSYENWSLPYGHDETPEQLVVYSWDRAEEFVTRHSRPDSCIAFVVGPYPRAKQES